MRNQMTCLTNEIMNLLMLEADEMEYEIDQRNQAERETAARFKRLKDDLRNAIDQTSIQPKKVIFQNPATIVYWADGSRTIVKACKEDTFNEETGFAMAYLKHLFGDNAKEFHKLFNLTDVDICRRDPNAKAKKAEKKAKAREKAEAKEKTKTKEEAKADIEN
ncbi:hypothetical protein SAMN05216391_11913 [Lachnospiraceae bacterium KHCPX20]|nr:hypothetical protein SAMN05216391_11913 [Lachnospiraceae bacterium KHCPX20]